MFISCFGGKCSPLIDYPNIICAYSWSKHCKLQQSHLEQSLVWPIGLPWGCMAMLPCQLVQLLTKGCVYVLHFMYIHTHKHAHTHTATTLSNLHPPLSHWHTHTQSHWHQAVFLLPEDVDVQIGQQLSVRGLLRDSCLNITISNS